jgi:hypothetical protein
VLAVAASPAGSVALCGRFAVMDERQLEDTNTTEAAKERHLPARLREISALAKRLRLLLADAEAGNHVPFREVSEVEDFLHTKKLDPPEQRRVMDLEWHDMFTVVVSRLGKVVGLGAGFGLFIFIEGPDGDIERRWMGGGEVLARARRLLRVAETLVSDYHATFR